MRNEQPITMADVTALKDVYQAPHIQEVAPIVRGNVNASFSGESTSAELFGVTPEFELVRNYELIEGSFITDDNVNGLASVALLGPEVADKLFGRQGIDYR